MLDYGMLLKFMAFSASDYSYDEVCAYGTRHAIKMTTVTKMTRELIHLGWLKGDPLSSMNRTWRACSMKDDVRLAIVVNTTVQEADDIFEFLAFQGLNGRKISTEDSQLRILLRALNVYLRHRFDEIPVDFGFDVSSVIPRTEPDEVEKEAAAKGWMTSLMGELVSKAFDCHACNHLSEYVLVPAFTDFFKRLPDDNVLDFLLAKVFDANDMQFLGEDELRVAFELLDHFQETSPVCSAEVKDDFLLHHVFLKNGRMDEVMAQMHKGTFAFAVLTALERMQQGKFDDAFAVMDALLKKEYDILNWMEYSVYVYLVAMLRTNVSKSFKRAEAFLKNREIKKCRTQKLVSLMSELKLNPHAEYEGWIHTAGLDLTNAYDMQKALYFMMCRHFDVDSKNNCVDKGFATQVVFLGLKPLFVDFYDDYFKEYGTAWLEDTGLRSILPHLARLEEWEKVINSVMKVYPEKKAAKSVGEPKPKMNVERIVYMLDASGRYYSVQPKLQKSKNGGETWTGGRNIALQTFMKGRLGMTLQDRAVASLVKSYEYGWYGSIGYELSGKSVVEALIGCPTVFDVTNPDMKIDIVGDKLQVQVMESKSGDFRIKTNLPGDSYETINIIRDNVHTLRVIKLNKNQMAMLKAISRMKVFPKEARGKLVKMLEAISVDVTVMSSLLKDTTVIAKQKGNSELTMQLVPYGDMFSMECFVKPLGSTPPYCTPGRGLEFVAATVKGKAVQVERNLKKEKENRDQLLDWMEPYDPYQTENGWLVPLEECLQVLEILRQHADICSIEWPEGVKLRVSHPALTADSLHLSVFGLGGWFQMDGEAKIDDGLSMRVGELLNRVSEAQGNFIQVGDNEYVAISRQLKKHLSALEKIARKDKEGLKVSSFSGDIVQGLEEVGVQLKSDKEFKGLQKRIAEADGLNPDVPKSLQAELRDYQKDGFRWMMRLVCWGAGACLADDMGLGKTVQTIAVLLSRAKEGPQMVVMPTSVLMNWRNELNRFAPSLNVLVLGQAQDRKGMVEGVRDHDVLLATYGLLQTECELLASREWNTVVLDEAHTIKNKETKTSKAAMTLKAGFRIMLTGTPLQNHLGELWNLFQFATPGLLGTYNQFTDRFILPIERDKDKDVQRILKRMISPFILRRTKNDVLTELPEKTEITLNVELSPMEVALYDRLRREAVESLEDGTMSPVQALAQLTKLRLAACNASLVLPAKEAAGIPSSKLEALMELVDELVENNHRALIFSQFTSHLDIIRKELGSQKIEYLYLDGSVTAQKRVKLVEAFQKGEMPLFLISLKAGGLGLNLTAADYVIHMDPWWNPAIEDQASDRSYRIGQDRPVTVYRLIAVGTIEEKILALHQTKKSLADALLEGSDMSHTLGKDEILQLLSER